MEEDNYGFIYITTNLLDGRKYIGQKKYSYGWEKYLGSGVHLNLAIEKYGIENFNREIVEYCKSREELNEREKHWIRINDAMRSDDFYNLTSGGDGGAAFGHAVSVETRKKLSEKKVGFKHTPQSKIKISEAAKNRFVSDETKKKHRDAMLGKKHTEQAKLNMSIAQTGHFVSEETRELKRIPVNQIDSNGNIIRTWNSAKQAYIESGYSRSKICNCCKGDRKTHAGYKWEYARQ